MELCLSGMGTKVLLFRLIFLVSLSHFLHGGKDCSQSGDGYKMQNFFRKFNLLIP